MTLLEQLKNVRNLSVQICEPLEYEDYVVQTITDVSPLKWHLGHTTWFFEEFILTKFDNSYSTFHEKYSYLFNSYYNSVGDRTPKPNRGMLSRPTVKQIFEYRNYVDTHLTSLFESTNFEKNEKEIRSLVTIGVHHEQQHQELMMYDIKHILYTNPIESIYTTIEIPHSPELQQKFIKIESGVYSIGKKADDNFGFDNEYPEHQHFLESFSISNLLVTNGEYLEFVKDDGYNNSLLWLSDGWDFIKNNAVQTPLYWKEDESGKLLEWTFYGWQTLDLNAPVSHISFYEADAFARWKQCRLPTEAEWEIFAQKFSSISTENFIDSYNLLPFQNNSDYQLNGYLWEWTSSAYSSYPGYKQPIGAIGEYNGKFMINQMILRGGSYATSKTHHRNTYRNFFQPDKRWLFNGIRLVEN